MSTPQCGSAPLAQVALLATYLRRYALPLTLILSANLIHAAEPQTVSLKFEIQTLDLDQNLVLNNEVMSANYDGADILIAYHADRAPHATLVVDSGTRISWILGKPLAEVAVDDITNAVFSDQMEDLPFESGNSVLVKTPDGSIFLIGEASEASDGVSFRYMRVE